MRRIRCDACADRDPQRLTVRVQQCSMSADGGGEAFGHLACSRQGSARQQCDKLVAAPARSKITPAQRTPQHLADKREHRVACQNAMHVVHPRELVDVDDEQCALTVRGTGAGDRIGGGNDEFPAEGQSGQVVGRRIVRHRWRCDGPLQRGP